jgi:GT2 family glycosyltransferase
MFAIIIINYNSYEKTIDCIASIRKTCGVPYRVYLIDNASANDSAAVLEKEYKDAADVRLILSKENLGYARGNNRCIKEAIRDGYKYALISNNDIVYEQGALDSLYEEITKNEYLIVGPQIVKPEGEIQRTVKYASPRFVKYIVRETYVSSLLRKFIKKEQVPEKKQDVYWIAGCAFAANLEMLDRIGLFDDRTFLYFEEYILAEKAKRTGMKMEYLPEARALHYHGYSMGGSANIVTRLANLKSEMLFLHEYMHWGRFKTGTVKLIRMLEVRFNLRKAPDRKEKWAQYRLECKQIG